MFSLVGWKFMKIAFWYDSVYWFNRFLSSTSDPTDNLNLLIKPTDVCIFHHMVALARGVSNSLPFFLTNVKLPWPTEITIQQIIPDDGLNPSLTTILSTHLFMHSHPLCPFYFCFQQVTCMQFTWMVICIFQAVCQFFCEYLIILAQRGKNRSGD